MKVNEDVIADDVTVQRQLTVAQQLVSVEDFVGRKFAGVEDNHLSTEFVVAGDFQDSKLGDVVETLPTPDATMIHAGVTVYLQSSYEKKLEQNTNIFQNPPLHSMTSEEFYDV